MRYLALATDYDGTLAKDGRVADDVLEALERLRGSGRRAILVTGRILDDVLDVFESAELFDAVVAENGGLLYLPDTKERRVLTAPPSSDLISELEELGVPFSVGDAIVATWEPNETHVLESIRKRGLELQVIFNKGAVMVLPSGVNKATGLGEALRVLGLSPHNVVAIGDAENDHAFLQQCECSVAVANALPTLKEGADLVTKADHGAGVVEVIEQLLDDDLSSLESTVRHDLLLGGEEGGNPSEQVRIRAFGETVLLAGPSESGKSTIAGRFLERLADSAYQFCLFDPEGDYETLEDVLVSGDNSRPPSVDEVIRFLEDPSQNVVINLLGLPLEDRPAFFETVLPRLLEMRTKQGRPHWIVIDEAHHEVPSESGRHPLIVPEDLGSTLLITVHPDHLDAKVLKSVDVMVVTGDPGSSIEAFARTGGEKVPANLGSPGEGEAVFWRRSDGSGPRVFKVLLPKAEHRRHLRKYAEGELAPDRSFYFRGPDGKLNLRAQNLNLFTQLAGGVDDETWMFHLSQGDYSAWFEEVIKDEDLAETTRQVEKESGLTPQDSRDKIAAAIEERYTLPV